MERQLNTVAGVVLGILVLGVSGCGNSGFPTAPVTGVVLCEGKPVANAMVYFEPIASQGGAKTALLGKQGFSFTDESGRFEISTYEPNGKDGAVIGRHRVRVGKGDSQCDCTTNDEMTLMEVDVQEGAENDFEIVLKKAVRQPPKVLMPGDEDEPTDKQ